MTPKSKGLICVFTGNGKGKTTAALGAVVRAVGHGLRACVIFFMKGDYPYGEFQTLARLPNVDVATFGFRKLTDPANIQPEEIEQAEAALAAAREAMLSGRYDLLVLDEINVALAMKLIKLDDVLRLLQDKPPELELFITGRYADSHVIELADLVSEVVKVKHPYDRGIRARKGIEY